jgi:hypothetical protein
MVRWPGSSRRIAIGSPLSVTSGRARPPGLLPVSIEGSRSGTFVPPWQRGNRVGIADDAPPPSLILSPEQHQPGTWNCQLRAQALMGRARQTIRGQAFRRCDAAGPREPMTCHVGDMVIEEMVEDLIVRGSGDWVMLTEIDWVAKSNASRHGVRLDVPARITVGVEVLRRVLERGFMIPGDVLAGPSGFVAWDSDWSVALERIQSGWQIAGENLQMGDVCWLANTPHGDRHAETILDEVNARAGWPPSDV